MELSVPGRSRLLRILLTDLVSDEGVLTINPAFRRRRYHFGSESEHWHIVKRFFGAIEGCAFSTNFSLRARSPEPADANLR